MGSVSLVIPYTDRWYFAGVLDGVRGRIEQAGHELRLHVIPPTASVTARAADAVEADFADADCIGAIAAGIKYHPDERARTLAWERPVVVVGGSATGFPAVLIDDLGGARAATEHLLALGHTRIAHVAGHLAGQMDFSVHGRRAKGYRLAMEGSGLTPRIVEAEFDPDAAYAAGRALLSSADRPTALFVVSDEVAYPVLAAARDLGLRIGQDVSVVGFDDHPRAEQEDLTTVRQVPRDLGAAAADLLLSGLSHGPDPSRSRLLPAALVKRGSSRRLAV